VDEHGAELNILLQKWRNKAAALRRAPRSSPLPRKIVTYQLRSYPAAKGGIPELISVKHLFVKAAARLNNRAENSHQPTCERERRMRGFRDPKRTQEFLACFGPIRQHFALSWHVIRASLHRKRLEARFVAWREFAKLAPNPSTTF
jgi:putative transposase